ncbi:MAG: hypothetical protein WA484_09730 [Solirubrobacteraceae bacterium]
MRVAWRSLLVCVLGCFAGLLLSCGAAYAEDLSASGGLAFSEGSMGAPGVEALAGSQLVDAEAASYANPEAADARLASATAYEGMSAESAESLSGTAFPGLIDESDGGPPRLPAGQQLTSYVDPYAADVSLSDGERGLVESSVPMAIEASPGSWSPVNLGLRDVGGAFEPVSPLVAARAPKLLSEGMMLPGLGITITPVDGQHAPLGGSEGVEDGATVFFGNTQTDSDTVFKPTTLGLSIDTLLRSERSPEQLSFLVGLPVAASLAVADDGSGSVSVVREGATIASVPAPVAHDATGRSLPVTMSVSGDVLTLTVARQPGAVAYPVDVDPEFNTTSEAHITTANWVPHELTGGGYEMIPHPSLWSLGIYHKGSFGSGDWAYWTMHTNGDSKIYSVTIKDGFSPVYGEGEGRVATYPYFSSWFEIVGGSLGMVELTGKPYLMEASLCAVTGCGPEGGSQGDSLLFEMETLEPSNRRRKRHTGRILGTIGSGDHVDFATEGNAFYGGLQHRRQRNRIRVGWKNRQSG